MSDPTEGSTPSANETEPHLDEGLDPAGLQAAEDLDEDELGTDPLEAGVEPPEHWSAVAADPPTPREGREPESLDERLAEESPDQEPVGTTPLAERSIGELDDSVDDRATREVADATGEQDTEESLIPDDDSARGPEEAAERVEDRGW